jgi:fucose permease
MYGNFVTRFFKEILLGLDDSKVYALFTLLNHLLCHLNSLYPDALKLVTINPLYAVLVY